MRYIFSESRFLAGMLFSGASLVLYGGVYECRKTMAVLGSAFIIAGSMGICMMISTRMVARRLHERFDKLNNVLQDIAATQNRTLTEIASSRHNIEVILKK